MKRLYVSEAILTYITEIIRVLPKGGTVYLVGGSSALSDSVVSAVTALGDVPVRLGGLTRAATAVDRGDAGLRIQTASGAVLDARAVVISTPAYVTSEIVRGLDPELARLCAEVPYASTATVPPWLD